MDFISSIFSSCVSCALYLLILLMVDIVLLEIVLFALFNVLLSFVVQHNNVYENS